MNMKFLAVLTPSPAMYHGWSTHKTLWEENFALVNMISCGRENFRKHRYINNGEKYIILDIYFKIDCLDNR